MLSGGLAGACATTVIFPFDFARTKLSTDSSGQYNGFTDCIKKTVKKDGVLGMYKGVSMALTGVFLATGLTLGTYDFLKTNVLTDKTPFL